MIKKIISVSLLVLIFYSRLWTADSLYALNGTVRDLNSKEIIADAMISLVNSTQRTISNAQGNYYFRLPSGNYSIAVNYIGYYTDTITLSLQNDVEHNINLQPRPIVLSEVVITDKNIASAIIESAIENKNNHKSKTYQLKVFSREIILNDTTINLLAESYSSVWYRSMDSLQEVIYQKRSSVQYPNGEEFVRFGKLLNFYQDTIQFLGKTFISPLSRNAFSFYRFKLNHQRWVDNILIYDIDVQPISKNVTLFQGVISIADVDYAIAEIQLAPNNNDLILHKLISSVDLRISELFTRNKEHQWLPISYSITADIAGDILYVYRFSSRYEKKSVVFSYKDAPQQIDSIDEFQFDTQSQSVTKYDPQYWKNNIVLPLTEKESNHLKFSDTSKTILGNKISDSLEISMNKYLSAVSFVRNIYFNFTRVTGFTFGLRAKTDTNIVLFKSNGNVYYGMSDHQWYCNLDGVLYPATNKKVGFGINLFRKLQSPPHAELYSVLMIFMGSVIAKNEYLDYYVSQGVNIFIEWNFIKNLFLQTIYSRECHSNKENVTQFSIMYPTQRYRPNINIWEGNVSSLKIQAWFTYDHNTQSKLRAATFIEHSDQSMFQSNYNFTSLYSHVYGETSVFDSGKENDKSISIFLCAGKGYGKLPPQKLFSPETHLSIYGPFGTLKGLNHYEMMGNQFYSATVAYNVGKNGTKYLRSSTLSVNYSFALVTQDPYAFHSYYQKNSTARIFYHEMGVDIGIYESIKLNVSFRITKPESLLLSITSDHM